MQYSIIGFGQVGKNLALKLASEELLNYVFVRNLSIAQNQSKIIGLDEKYLTDDLDVVLASDVIIIAINDNQIRDFAIKVSEFLKQKNVINLNKRVIFHTSGLQNADILDCLIDYNFSVFAAHPIQTFFSISQNLLNNIHWGIESGNTNPQLIEKIITELDGNPYFLDEKAKNNRALYHLMCVATSNFSVVTMEFGKLVANEIGIIDKTILSRLFEQTSQNIIANINSETMPLTGPFARNDYEAIMKYSDSLKNNQNLFSIFENYKKIVGSILETEEGKVKK